MHRDVALFAPSGVVDFTRFYNSTYIQNGALGYGWSFMPYELDVQEIVGKPAGKVA